MCGRYVMKEDNPRAIQALFPQVQFSMLQPSYNIAPSQQILVVLKQNNNIEAKYLTWGLVPSWSKEIGPGFNNARVETVFEKPSFKDAIRSRRCVIPANGYYEWKKEGKLKQPYYISFEEPLIGFAGIWDKKILENGTELLSCAILTTQATEELQHIHDRMPLILSNATECQEWVISDESTLYLNPYKQVQNASYYPVSKTINRTQFNDSELIKEELPSDIRQSLF